MLKRYKWIIIILLVLVFLPSKVFSRANKFAVYHYTKGYLELYKGDFSSATVDLWKVFPYVTDADFYNQLSDLLVYKGEYAKAEMVLNKAIKVYPYDKEFYYKLFDIYAIEGKRKKSLEIMTDIKKKFKYNADTLKRLAMMYIKSSDYQKAYDLLKKYLNKKKDDPVAHFYLANVCMNLKRDKCALKEAYTAYNLSLKNPRFGIFLAALYDQFGYFDKAIEIYKTLPKNGPTMYAIGNDYYLLGQLNKSERFYSRAFNISKRVDYLEKLVFVKIKLGKYNDVIDICSRYKPFVSDSDRLKLLYAIALSRESRYDDALKELARINRKVGFYEDVLFNEIYCYFKKGNLDKVREILSRNNDLTLYFMVIGSLCTKDGKYRFAIELLSDALISAKTMKEKTSVLMYMADIYYNNLHDKAEAIKVLNRLIKMYPNYAEGLNYLGYLYIDEDINVKEGMRLVKRALDIDKNNPYYLDSMGWGYFKLRDYANAALYLRRALTYYKKSDKKAIVTTLEHLLIVYEGMKNHKEAQSVAREILKIDPSNGRAKAFMQKR